MPATQFGCAHIHPAVAAGIPKPNLGIAVEIVIVLCNEIHPNVIKIELRLGRIIPARLGANLIDQSRARFESHPVFIAALAKVQRHRSGQYVRE